MNFSCSSLKHWTLGLKAIFGDKRPHRRDRENFHSWVDYAWTHCTDSGFGLKNQKLLYVSFIVNGLTVYENKLSDAMTLEARTTIEIIIMHVTYSRKYQ